MGPSAAQHLFEKASLTAYTGFFAAQREHIVRWPRELYEAIAVQQVAPNEEVDHFIERTWGLLLSVPSVPPNFAVKRRVDVA